MNPERSFWRREAPVALLWLLGLLAALAALGAVTSQLAERHLRGDAEATALRYAEVVAATVPELQAVFGGQAPQGETLDQLRRLRRVGEIFRFKLFDRDGRQVLVSDDPLGLTLTPAEVRLLPYLSTHLTFAQIAATLFLSRNTIGTQVGSIYRKLGVSSRADAVQRLQDLGFAPRAPMP